MKADIILGENVVLRGIDVSVHVQKLRGLKSWHGSFTVDHPSQLSQDDEYQLVLSDRGSGRILITRKSYSAGSGTTFVQFHGYSPLKQRSRRETWRGHSSA